MPRVSVIIPLYNKGPYIERTILTVLSQTFQNFEIIVIDGGSKDNGPEIVKKIKDPRIKFFTQTRKGVSNARNEAVINAKYDFIAFLDADDEWTPEHLAILLSLKEKYPHAGLFASRFVIKNEFGKLIPYKNRLLTLKDEDGLINRYFLVAAVNEPVTTSGAGMSKEIFLEFGGFPEGIPFGEDMVLWGKIALKYPIAYSKKIGAIYHHDAVNRASQNIGYYLLPYPFIKFAKEAIREIKVTPQTKKDLIEYIARKELNRAAAYLFNGDRLNAKNLLMQIRTRYFVFDKTMLLTFIFLPTFVVKLLETLRKLIRKY